MNIPTRLQSTAELISRAYTEGVPPEDYFPLLFFMSEHFCEENVSILAAVWRGRIKGSPMNDVLAAKAAAPDSSLVVQKLKPNGLEEWLRKAD
jgi:hypothetical protein